MTIEEVFKNKDIILAKKKNAIKHADNVVSRSFIEQTEKGDVVKSTAIETTEVNPSILSAKLVINTTNVIDSHMDCHIPGLWKKSISELVQTFLLQEHEMEFKKIIADSAVDSIKVSTEVLTFSKLGYTYKGNTEALIFDVQIKNDVNPFMFDLYKRGRVSQHSVGMRYVKIFLCINSEEATYSSEKENWDKYYPMVANKEVADEKGYFWAVTEAKIIEGSAVVKGSNGITPVMEVEIEKGIEAVDNGTSTNEPPKGTQNEKQSKIYSFI